MRKWRATWLGSRFSKSTLEDFTENKNPEVCPKTIAKTNIKRSKLAKKFEITKFKVRFFNHFIWPMVRDYKKITCPNLLKDRKLFKNLLIPCSFLPLNSFPSQSISIHLNQSQSINPLLNLLIPCTVSTPSSSPLSLSLHNHSTREATSCCLEIHK